MPRVRSCCEKFDTLPPDLQEILLRNGRKYMGDLTRKSRDENAAAIQTMRKNGVTILEVADPHPSRNSLPPARRLGSRSSGKLFDQDFLNRVEKAVADFRATQRGKK